MSDLQLGSCQLTLAGVKEKKKKTFLYKNECDEDEK